MIDNVLRDAIRENASDVLIAVGSPLCYKIAGVLSPRGNVSLTRAHTEAIVREIYALAFGRSMDRLINTGDDDFSFSVPGCGRFRVAAFRQRGSLAAVVRIVRFELPDPAVLGIPPSVVDLYKVNRGLVLVTGPAGSGKSTTLSCIVAEMNKNLTYHIVTIEDPIEFLYKNDKSIISQREVNSDTEGFKSALRYALRQAPNVILVGEMRDYETVSIAMSAAETGQYVLSTLHTVGAAKTVDRIVDSFPAEQQHQARLQLSLVLQAVVSQQLLPTVDGGTVPAFEVMIVNPAIRNLIREGKAHQIDNIIYANPKNMMSMDLNIIDLYRKGRITLQTALLYATDAESMQDKLARNY